MKEKSQLTSREFAEVIYHRLCELWKAADDLVLPTWPRIHEPHWKVFVLVGSMEEDNSAWWPRDSCVAGYYVSIKRPNLSEDNYFIVNSRLTAMELADMCQDAASARRCIREIEKAIRWCYRQKEKRLKMAESILRRQRRYVEMLEGELVASALADGPIHVELGSLDPDKWKECLTELIHRNLINLATAMNEMLASRWQEATYPSGGSISILKTRDSEVTVHWPDPVRLVEGYIAIRRGKSFSSFSLYQKAGAFWLLDCCPDPKTVVECLNNIRAVTQSTTPRLKSGGLRAQFRMMQLGVQQIRWRNGP